jgi:hypothetical protein
MSDSLSALFPPMHRGDILIKNSSRLSSKSINDAIFFDHISDVFPTLGKSLKDQFKEEFILILQLKSEKKTPNEGDQWVFGREYLLIREYRVIEKRSESTLKRLIFKESLVSNSSIEGYKVIELEDKSVCLEVSLSRKKGKKSIDLPYTSKDELMRICDTLNQWKP